MELKIKLPRKRKKAFIKALGRGEYIAARILGDLLREDGRKHAERFYQYKECVASREHPQGYKIAKRW